MSLFSKLSSYDNRYVVQLGFAAVIILVLVFAITSLYQIRQSTSNLTEIVEINNAKVTHIYKMRDIIRQRQIILNQMLSVKDEFSKDELSLAFFEVAGEFRQAREALENLPINKAEKILIDGLIKQIRVAQPLNREAVEALKLEIDPEVTVSRVKAAQLAQAELMKRMQDLINLQIKYEHSFVAEARKNYEFIFFWSISSAVFLIVLATVIGRAISHYVSQKNRELMQKNEELEIVSRLALEATKTKSDFLATMSHEIRTPLTSIIGFSEIILNDAIRPEDRKRHTQSIVRNGRHLLQIINDILDISKFEADRIEFTKEQFSPFKVIQEVEQVVLPQAKTKGLEVNVVYEFPMPEFIIGDPLRF